jgi:hypothetical protein
MSALEEAFRSFCTAGKKDVDCRGFIRLCRECELTGDACPDSEVERIFQSVMSVSKRRVDFKRFEGALRLIAERIGVSVEDVQKSVVENSSPTSSVQDSKRRGSVPRSEGPNDSELQHLRTPEEKRGRKDKDTDQSDPRASSASPAVLYKPSSCPFISYPKHVQSLAAELPHASSQEPHPSCDDICDGEDHTSKEEIVAPPPSPAHSNFGSPKFRRAQSLTSLTGSTSASFLRGEDRAPLQKRRSNLFTSMPLMTAMSRNLPPSPSFYSATGDSSNNDESVGSGSFQAGNSQIRKKCFTSMPMTFVMQSSPQLADLRRYSDSGLQHSSSAPMLEPMTGKNMSFNDHCLQHAIWPSMPLCPVVRAH